MEEILTANVANSLYWFGRYLERVEATLLEITQAFDIIIDVNHDEGKRFYKHFDVEIEYDSPAEFLDVAIFGEHSSNLLEAIVLVRENAIISRAHIETEAFGSVIKLYELFQKSSKSAQYVDYQFINKAQAIISEIWGKLTQKQKRGKKEYFIRLGKLIEKVDFHIRLERKKDFVLVIMDEIDTIVEILAPDSEFKDHTNSTSEELLESINNKIYKIIVE